MELGSAHANQEERRQLVAPGHLIHRQRPPPI